MTEQRKAIVESMAEDTSCVGASKRDVPTESQAARFAIITATNPRYLTKRFSLVAGALKKETGGVLVEGRASVTQVNSLEAFAEILQSLGPDQALTYGVPADDEVSLVTKERWQRLDEPDNPIPRTNETFDWPRGPGILMIDYDPAEGEAPLSSNELVEAIRAAAPGLSKVEMLTWPSASSWIKDAETGAWLKKAGGLRLYLLVDDARDIPRAGKLLCNRLWLAGHGYIKISGSGSMLLRTLADGMVWQSSRLDFAAGAMCERPLVQDRGEPQIIAGAQKRVDTRLALPGLTEHESKRLAHLQAAAKKQHEADAVAAREAWLERRISATVPPDSNDEASGQAREVLLNALETDTLSGNFVIDVEVGRTVVPVRVDEILADPARYDRCRTRDPIEPDYDDGRLVGMLFLDGATKTLHSFARGEKTYRLNRGLEEITVPMGKLAEAVEETIEVIRRQDNLFDRGDELVELHEGRIMPLDEHALNQRLGRMVQYVRFDRKGRKICADPPVSLSKRILSLGARRNLRQLAAVITAPTLRRDGSVLDASGYDRETGLFLYLPEGRKVSRIPLTPSLEECREQLTILWKPFEDFPFVDEVDRAVMLSALLTACVRAALPTAPAFGFDAPVQGSGKSLLASCIAALAGELAPSVSPHTYNEEEIRKRLLTILREARAALIWDNVLGEFDSAAFAALLTSEHYTDRVLGASKSVTLPTTVLVTITGNNLVLKGDMTRRVLAGRIDPQTDMPHAREFELDPLAHVKVHRDEMVVAALTLLRGSLTSEKVRAKGRMASFEVWDDLVRQAVIWIGTEVSPGGFADPMRATERAMENDPELDALRTLLATLQENFGEGTFRTSEVMEKVAKFHDPGRRNSSQQETPEFRLYEALIALNDSALRSSVSLGKTLKNRKGRIVGGLFLRQSTDSHTKTSLWRVAPV